MEFRYNHGRTGQLLTANQARQETTVVLLRLRPYHAMRSHWEGDRTPILGSFLLRKLELPADVADSPHGHVGAYNFASVNAASKIGELLCSAPSIQKLIRKLRRLPPSKVAFPVNIVIATTSRELPKNTVGKPDAYVKLKQEAHLAVEEAKKRGDTHFLKGLQAEIKDRKSPGRKADLTAQRRVIKQFQKYCETKSFKSLLPEGQHDVDKFRRNIATRCERLSTQSFQLWRNLGCPKWQVWHLPQVARDFERECGFIFPDEIWLARQAVEYGQNLHLKAVSKQRRAATPISPALRSTN